MNKTKVLVVEDDVNICKLINDYMSGHGYEVTTVMDGTDALDYIRERGLPHIALIDLALPTMHGFELSSRLKAMADVPIIFVTSTSDTDTIVQGLRRYAEDFIVKPFELRELEARVQAVLARMPSLDYASEPVVQVDEHLQVDFAHNRLVLNSKVYSLTPTESILLHVLMRNAGRVVENRMLIARVWPSEDVYEDTLRVHMHRLRRKLESDSHHPHYIRTERGIGYMFTVRPPENKA
ncbi:MAG: response regulator transcription factor [Chloroflexi bacterium]|nr:response regulator transcription factor [Chloroflexota bacterium]MCC6892858.1 response regulator transcription factor [Anaerolineae bacterium]